MAVRGAWHSTDRPLKVELREDGGKRALAVVVGDLVVAEFPTVQWLDAFLWEVYRLTFVDLVAD